MLAHNLRKSRYVFFGVLVFAASVTARSQGLAQRWYRVSPEADVTGSVNLHEWRVLAAAPDAQGAAVVITREAVTAERLERLAGAFDIDMRHAGDEAALHWMMRATEAEETGRSSRVRRFAGWLSDPDATHDEAGMRPDGQNGATANADIFGRSWGWLADDVQERAQAAARRDEMMRPDSQPGTIGDIFTIFADPGSVSGRGLDRADWTRGGGTDTGERSFPFDSGYNW